MDHSSALRATTRRSFLTTGGGVLAAAAMPRAALTGSDASSLAETPEKLMAAAKPGKLLIGVFDPVFAELSLDQMLAKVSGYGLEAMEIGTGGYPNNPHCPIDELLRDEGKLRAWKKKFEDHNLLLATLSCHGNPVHPNQQIAARDAETFRKTVLLAERIDVPVIVGFSGCPGGSANDTTPTWVTYGWPDEHKQALEWQWKEKVVPYWKQAAQFARAHGIRKLALEMHPNFVVYNPRTLIRLRQEVGEEIGANCDLSHLFWQGADPVEVIHFLGKQNAIFHAHMKDTVMFKDNIRQCGVLNFAFQPQDLAQASETFRAVGYGHGANLWKDVVRAYMEVGYQGILSIENEDPILPGDVGVERAAYVLKNIRTELLDTGAKS